MHPSLFVQTVDQGLIWEGSQSNQMGLSWLYFLDRVLDMMHIATASKALHHFLHSLLMSVRSNVLYMRLLYMVWKALLGSS